MLVRGLASSSEQPGHAFGGRSSWTVETSASTGALQLMETACTFIGPISIVRRMRSPGWMSIAEEARVSTKESLAQSNARRHRRKERDDLENSGRLRERSQVLLTSSQAGSQSRVSVERRGRKGELHSDPKVADQTEASPISDSADLLIKRSKGGDSL